MSLKSALSAVACAAAATVLALVAFAARGQVVAVAELPLPRVQKEMQAHKPMQQPVAPPPAVLSAPASPATAETGR